MLPCGVNAGRDIAKDRPGPEQSRDRRETSRGRVFTVRCCLSPSLVWFSPAWWVAVPFFGRLTILVNLTYLEVPGPCLVSVIRLCHSNFQVNKVLYCFLSSCVTWFPLVLDILLLKSHPLDNNLVIIFKQDATSWASKSLSDHGGRVNMCREALKIVDR